MEETVWHPATPEDLSQVLERWREDTPIGRMSVRELLRLFGYSRRTHAVVALIRRALNEHGIKTVPDFEEVFLDGKVRFMPDFKQADVINEETAATIVLEKAQPSVDPTLRLGRLPAANKALISVRPDALLAHAVTEMMNRDYSQLPVMVSERDVKGVISWTSIGTRLSNGLQPTYVREAMDPAIEAAHNVSLFAAIPIVVKHDYLLVRGIDQRITGIITASDLGLQFQQLAEPFLLLGEIEIHIRAIIDAAKFTIEELGTAVDLRDGNRVVRSAEDMNFGEYIRLLQNEAHWKKSRLKLERVTFCRYLDEVRRIRNDVMHFDPDGIDEEDLERVRRLANMLQRLGSINNS